MEKSLSSPKILSLVIYIIGAVLGILDIVSGATSFGSTVVEVTVLAVCYIIFGAALVLLSGYGLIRFKKIDDSKAVIVAFAIAAVFCLSETVSSIFTGIISFYTTPEGSLVLFPFFLLLGIAYGVPAILYVIASVVLKAAKSPRILSMTASIILLICGGVELLLVVTAGSTSTSALTYILLVVLIIFAGVLSTISGKSGELVSRGDK